ncbi:5'-methylthioadenosine/adenosylhomocysteine nucleosidase [Propionicicella superfundia]|uniref:5'-methylthioadenosine/adenosylhomocysteine nucleosidase n=1 Tax=Propionicicella superfundia TaxID=348582 RepID=UPI00041EACCD|nr:5'-methylthioadenosine/adenosylhomocysteine nucleosidase [Propionicicella superfundia]
MLDYQHQLSTLADNGGMQQRVVAVVAAMAEELRALADATAAEGAVREEHVLGRSLRHGTLAGTPVVLARSGVGKVAAAATAAILCQRADAVVMVGTAGGLAPEVRPGDVVVADALLQHDVDPRPLFPRWQVDGVVRLRPDPELTGALGAAASDAVAGHRDALAALGLPTPRWHTGLIVSGDQFIADSAASDALRRDLPDALAVEMEGAAVAQVCTGARVPFAVARTISDRADDDAHVDFARFLATVAAPYARDLVVRALTILG